MFVLERNPMTYEPLIYQVFKRVHGVDHWKNFSVKKYGTKVKAREAALAYEKILKERARMLYAPDDLYFKPYASLKDKDPKCKGSPIRYIRFEYKTVSLKPCFKQLYQQSETIYPVIVVKTKRKTKIFPVHTPSHYYKNTIKKPKPFKKTFWRAIKWLELNNRDFTTERSVIIDKWNNASAYEFFCVYKRKVIRSNYFISPRVLPWELLNKNLLFLFEIHIFSYISNDVVNQYRRYFEKNKILFK